MQKCLMLYDDSLKFSRATYGTLTLIAFLTRSEWLILAISFLMAIGTFSLKLNIPYQFHAFAFRKMLKEKSALISKDHGEINFVSGMTAALLFIGFLFIHFNKFVDLAWIYILIMALLIFLACFVGFCVATLMYVLFKKMFKK
jgi:hypothetical protein